jgi:hypothetical protein
MAKWTRTKASSARKGAYRVKSAEGSRLKTTRSGVDRSTPSKNDALDRLAEEYREPPRGS